jgi:hypothetical protein
MNKGTYNNLVWDYDLPQDEFEAILRNEKTLGSLDQSWAMARILENLNYYDAMKLISMDSLKRNWISVKKKLFKNSIKEGYEFVLQRYAVSTAG